MSTHKDRITGCVVLTAGATLVAGDAGRAAAVSEDLPRLPRRPRRLCVEEEEETYMRSSREPVLTVNTAITAWR
eukprot:5411221-Prymnesium_polylepis.1